MTVATNALLEGRSARTALIATEGFADLIELGRQARPELYRLCVAGPAPLVPGALRFEAPERMTPDGPLRTARARRRGRTRRPDRRSRGRVGRDLPAPRLPPPGARAGDRPRAAGRPTRASTCRSPTSSSGRSASTSGPPPPRSTPRSRRCSRATCAGSPSAAPSSRLPTPAIMSSAGGLISLEQAAAHAALTVLSGPAAGAAGAAHIAARAGRDDALCFDMGGTSCDVCVVEDGRVAEQSGGELAGRPLALPMLAIHTVGAGGGSIAWRDPGGALCVGPRSAGADPGPCGVRSRRQRADRHRREPRARTDRDARRRRRARPRRRAAGDRAARGHARTLRRSVRRGDHPGGQRRHGPGAAGRLRGTRDRSAAASARGVRRRRRAARLRGRAGAGDGHDPLPPQRRRARSARAGRRAGSSRRAALRDAFRVGADGDRGGRAGRRPRSPGTRRAPERGRARGDLRTPLPGPVLRAAGVARAWPRPSRSFAAGSIAHTTSATDSPIPTRSSSSSRSASPAARPLRSRSPLRRAAVCAARAARWSSAGPHRS